MAGKPTTRRGQGTEEHRQTLVADPLFQGNVFFNPRDHVQVKYEMLRRVHTERMAVAVAARSFGFSRVAFYAIRQRFQAQGMPGLLPRRRGPHGGHKLNEQTMACLDSIRRELPLARGSELAAELLRRTGLSVHPRSIARAIRKQVGKKGRTPRRR